jgi:hypothetical protein
MKKEPYLGGEKQEKNYYPKDFSAYFNQLIKNFFKKGEKK